MKHDTSLFSIWFSLAYSANPSYCCVDVSAAAVATEVAAVAEAEAAKDEEAQETRSARERDAIEMALDACCIILGSWAARDPIVNLGDILVAAAAALVAVVVLIVLVLVGAKANVD